MSKSPLKKLENAMSKFLDDTLALIKTIANGSADDQATKDAVIALNAKVSSDEADEAEVKQVVQALVAQLAAAPAVLIPSPAPDPQPDSATDSAS